MSIISTFTIQRPTGTTINAGIAFQIDDISTIVKAGSGGAIPYDAYIAISLFGQVDLQQGDLMIDENTSHKDKFGNQIQYRVSDNPEPFDDHTESLVVLNRQKTP